MIYGKPYDGAVKKVNFSDQIRSVKKAFFTLRAFVCLCAGFFIEKMEKNGPKMAKNPFFRHKNKPLGKLARGARQTFRSFLFCFQAAAGNRCLLLWYL